MHGCGKARGNAYEAANSDFVIDHSEWPPELSHLRTEMHAVLRTSPLLRHLGGDLVAWGLGWAEVRLPTEERFANLIGSVHGGIVNSAADAAFEAACNSYGRVAVAAGLSAQYTAPARVGTVLTATAAEVARGRRIASYRIDVSDSENTLVAWFQALAYRTDRWHLGENRWPTEWRDRY